MATGRRPLRVLPLLLLLLATLPLGPVLLRRPALPAPAAPAALAAQAAPAVPPAPSPNAKRSLDAERSANAERLRAAGEIRLLVWNMGKADIAGLEMLLADRRPALVCLQETRRLPERLGGYHAACAANVRLEGREYGLAILAPEPFGRVWRFAGRDREPLTGTPKVILAAELGPLLVVNVHSLNFRGLPAYRRQLNELEPLLSGHRGPLIVCGDFNAWSRNRDRFLAEWSARFGLTRVDFGRQTGRIRRFLQSPPFDRIYARGLEPRAGLAEVLRDAAGSDHAPLVVDLAPPR